MPNVFQVASDDMNISRCARYSMYRPTTPSGPAAARSMALKGLLADHTTGVP